MFNVTSEILMDVNETASAEILLLLPLVLVLRLMCLRWVTWYNTVVVAVTR